MFGTLGGQEIILILVIALIVFGPRKLPEIGKSVGRMMAEFRKASNDFRRTLEEEVEAEKARPSEPAAPLRAEPPAGPLTEADAAAAEADAASAVAVSEPVPEPAEGDVAAVPLDETTVPRAEPAAEPAPEPEPAAAGRPDGRPVEPR